MSRRPVGHDGARCGARKRQGEGACTQVAGWGTDHVGEGLCKLHGGSTPTVAAGAELRQVEAEVRLLFKKIAPDVRPIDNPLAAYASFTGRVMAWLDLMDSLLDGLKSPRYDGGLAGDQIRGEVLLFERAMDRANTVLSTYARLNIDERLAAISEAQKRMVIRAIEAGIAEAGVTGVDVGRVKAATARHLRAVS